MSHPVELAARKALGPSSLRASDMRCAIGFSGGGDSTALLYALREHAANIRVFIVDHGLRKGSEAEADMAKLRAQKWGYQANVLTWQPEPIRSALQDKARRARYGLIGAKMREEGLTHLLTGHTADDQAETCLMRYDRSTDWRGAAGMGASVYAPVWPELAGVTIVRPLLGCSRAQLRAYNRLHDLDWSEDPSNENRNYTRIQARDYLSAWPYMRDHFLSTAENLQSGLKQERKILSEWITRHAQINMNGYIQIEKVPPSEGLLYLIRAVSGQGGMVDRNSLIELRQRMKHLGFKAGTLGGAHIIKVGDQFLIARDPVIAKGRKGQKAPLGSHKLKRGGQIWDGRFLIENQHDRPLHVRPAWGFIDRLGRVVKEIPSEARPTLPVVLNEKGDVICLGSHKEDALNVTWLGSRRIFQSI